MKRFGFLLAGIILWIGASAQVQADTTQVTIPDSVIEKYAATSENTREAILLQKLNPDQLLEIEKQRLDNERRRESNEIPMPMWALVLISTAPFVMVVFIVFFTSRAKKEREKARYDLYLKSIEMGQPLPEKIFEEPEKKVSRLQNGLVWLGIGLALVIVGITTRNDGLLFGMVPGFIGLGILIAYLIEKPKDNSGSSAINE